MIPELPERPGGRQYQEVAMNTMDRRGFSNLLLAGAGAWAVAGAMPKIDSTVRGVRVGVQSYSFRDRPLDAAIEGMVAVGLGVCEVYSGHLEPTDLRRERDKLRQWRLSVSLDHFEAASRKFRDAGIELYAYNYSFRDDFTDAEIERGFEMAGALGAKVLTASSNVSTARRVDPFARKHKMRVGMHNHSRIRENEFATPQDFEAARRGMSDYIAINLDIGHFAAAGFDPVDYLARNHDAIVTLHIKDRKKDQGPNVPFGQGDTPIREALHLLREKKLSIPANIEYEYEGGDTVAEVRRCFEYCKKALES
jgi:sugar phosphate isomerase/epimerase